ECKIEIEEKKECIKNSDCNDNLFCTLDKCIDNKCVYNNLKTDDGISCTVDSCDEDNDKIIHALDNSLCQDGLYCNGAEICDDKKGCVEGEVIVCNDGIKCSMDSCEEGEDKKDNLGQCLYDIVDCKCKKDSDCNDNNYCTDDFCNKEFNCESRNDDANTCNDNLFCTINDRCNEGRCIGDNVNPDDKISCTLDSCDEINNKIVFNPDDSLCDDNLSCTSGICDKEKGCSFVINDNLCSDKIECTIDSCDVNEGCRNDPDNNLCISGEVCDPKIGCVQTSCLSCTDCDDFFGSCSYDECKIDCSARESCYYKGNVLGENCVSLDETCKSIDSCSDYSIEECANDPCSQIKRCEVDNGKCVEINYCSDGIIKGLEECDDGNLVNGDRCSAECIIEQDFDNDGVFEESNEEDTDNDGITNNLDSDDDGDGILTIQEIRADSNGNSVVAYLDADEKIIIKRKQVEREENVIKFIDKIAKKTSELPTISKNNFMSWLFILMLLLLIIYLIHKINKVRRKYLFNKLKKSNEKSYTDNDGTLKTN
ncbi:MAG: hypothetical protein AABX77_02920, partial [Nanoarchaeota archaeon]